VMLGRVAILTLGLLLPARAQQVWEFPPRHDLPAPFRGMPKHGELMAAGVACGLRPAEWEGRYRAAVEQRVRRLATSAGQADEVMQVVDAFAAYAQRVVAKDRKGYCTWTANPEDMQKADSVAAFREPPR
jgi:hypothetical protein